MPESRRIRAIAHMENDFPQKFGIPRQSGLVKELVGRVIFEREYRNPDALRGLEGFDYIWLIWGFDGERQEDAFHPTVRPPRLGGNTRMGVFATRSPFRPNELGLSCVRLLSVDYDAPEGPELMVGGADLKSGTPIFDIKPYLPYVDSHPDAASGFAGETAGYHLEVSDPEGFISRLPEDRRAALAGILASDPRPSYQNDPQRVYGLSFAGYEVKFRVEGEKLTVVWAEKA